MRNRNEVFFLPNLDPDLAKKQGFGRVLPNAFWLDGLNMLLDGVLQLGRSQKELGTANGFYGMSNFLHFRFLHVL